MNFTSSLCSINRDPIKKANYFEYLSPILPNNDDDQVTLSNFRTSAEEMEIKYCGICLG